ncbi:hypothetical protein [Orientia tsutsugamushi]|nr:hypothetical protein [Orientia tsutsugamushi]
MPLFIYYFLYSFHISILCTYFLRSCYITKKLRRKVENRLKKI